MVVVIEVSGRSCGVLLKGCSRSRPTLSRARNMKPPPDEGGTQGCKPAQVFDHANWQKKAVDLNEEHGKQIVLGGHGSVLDSLGATLSVGEIGEARVKGLPLDRVDPAAIASVTKQLGDGGLDGKGNISLRLQSGDLLGGKGWGQARPRKRARAGAAQGVDVRDLVVDDLLLHGFELCAVGGLGAEGGENPAREAAAGVDDLAPEHASLPPASVGGVVAEADDHADGSAIEGERNMTRADPLPVEQLVGADDGEIPGDEGGEGGTDVRQDAPEAELPGSNHSFVTAESLTPFRLRSAWSPLTWWKTRSPSSAMRTSPVPIS